MKRNNKTRKYAHVHKEHSAIYLFLTSIAFAISIASFAVYLFPVSGTATGFSIVASSPNYVLNMVIGSAGETTSSSSYSLLAAIGDALVGQSSGPTYDIQFGPIAFLSPPDEQASGYIDNGGPTCDLFQSASKIEAGQSVNLTVVCTDGSNVTLITLETDENNKVFKSVVAFYGSPKTVSGEKASATFIWQNADVKDGTRVSWRVKAKDGRGNEATQGTSSFDVGEVTATSNTTPAAQPPTQTPLQPLPTEEDKTEGSQETVGILPSIQEEEQPADNTAYLYLGIVALILAVLGVGYYLKHKKDTAGRPKQAVPLKAPAK